MPKNPRAPVDPPTSTRPSGLHRLGALSWSALGIIALVLVIASGVSALSGILIPLVIAVILGTVLEPIVNGLVRVRVPRVLASLVGLLVAIALAVGIGAVIVVAFVQQAPEISRQLTQGWASLTQWLQSIDVDPVWLDQLRTTLDDAVPQLGMGILGIVTSTFYGAISFGIGTFFALFFLFFVLRDGKLFPGWLARVTRQDVGMISEMDGLVRSSLRGYFRGTAVTALITAPIFIIPLLILRVPLVLPIVILYFFLSFVPYLGAWITGAFAILIAFGSGGATAALIVALSLLISNGTVQSAVSSWALGSALKLHPVSVLLTTLVGGVVAGIIGMVLGPPLVSAAMKIVAIARRGPKRTPPENGQLPA